MYIKRIRGILPARFAFLTLSAVSVFWGLPRESMAASFSPVVVSLEFDDGTADQYQVRSMLSSHGMHGVFFINSGRINLSGYMTLSQIQSLGTDGNQIAGHTVSHPDLVTLDLAERQRQICNDRVTLLNYGFQIYDFAYPFGSYDSATESIVQACGYNSGRGIGGIVSPGDCVGCAFAETIPPVDLWAARTPDSIKSNNTLADIQNYVTQAEQNGGGWVELVMHHICSGSTCDSYSVDPAILSSFLDWLQAHNASTGSQVKTIHEVIGGALQPPVNGPPPTSTLLQNSSLEDPATGSLPTCWNFTNIKGTDLTFPNGIGSRTSDAHTGSSGFNINTTTMPSGGASQLYSVQDLGTCAPPVNAGDLYQLTAWYKTTSQVRLIAYQRNSAGGWSFWQQSAVLPVSNTWTQATWTLPAIPSGDAGISVAVSQRSTGSVTMDDIVLTNANSVTTPPTISITSPADGSTVSGSVSLLTNTSWTVNKVEFYAGSSLIGTATTSPFSINWDSSPFAQTSQVITAKAYSAGGGTATASVNVVVESPPPAPSVTNLLFNPSLEQLATGSATTPYCWQLGGFGTNSATWTRTTDAHSGAYAENVQITSYTNGDAKLVVDQKTSSCWPAVTVGASYTVSGWYKSTARTRFAVYTHSSAGWQFWQQSAYFPAASTYTHVTYTTPAVPSGVDSLSFGLSLVSLGSLTMDDFGMTQVGADITPPTVAMTAPTNGATVSGIIPISATASDNVGVTKVEFYQGSTLLQTVTSGPYSINWDTTTVANATYLLTAKAYDAAGSSTTSTAVSVTVSNAPPPPPPDTTPPAVGITAPTNGATVSGTISVSATASDDVGVTKVEFYQGSTLLQTVTSGPYSINWDTTTVADAAYLVTAKAYDAAGNSTTSTAVSVTVSNAPPPPPPDTTPPAVSMTAPTNGATVSGTIPISATASDDVGVTKVEFYQGSTLLQTVTSGLYSINWDTTTVADAAYLLTAKAFDAAGNSTTSTAVSVTVSNAPPPPPPDTTPPTVATTAPTNGATVSGVIPFTATASDDVGVTKVEFYQGSTLLQTVTSGPYSINWDTTTVANAVYLLTAKAYDAAGNSTTSTAISVTVSNAPPPPADTTPPTTTIACGGTTCSTGWYASAVNITLPAIDNAGGSGVATTRYTIDGSIPSLTNGTTYVGAFTVSQTATLKYRSWDNAGNVEATNTQVIQIDTLGPSVSVTQPANNSTVSTSGTVKVLASATDSGGSGVKSVSFYLDGALQATVTATPYSWQWNAKKAKSGQHQLKATATDNAGNQTTSATITVTVP